MGRHNIIRKSGTSSPTDYVRYYKLDDNATNTIILDDKGVSNGVSSVNTSTISTTNAKVGTGLRGTGTNNLRFNLSALPITISYSFWVKFTTDLTTIRGIFNCTTTNDYSDGRYWVWLDNGIVYTKHYNTATVKLFTPLLDTWYNITMVHYTRASHKYYVNGVLKVNQESAYSFANGGYLQLLRTGDFATSMLGSVDELKVYDRILSDLEITALYNSYL